MAILDIDEGKLEVRIMEHPFVPKNQVYFEEFIKLGDREKKGAVEAERYIACEDNDKYGIQIRLKQGFRPGDWDTVKAKFTIPGQKKAVKTITQKIPLERDDQGGLLQHHTFLMQKTTALIGGKNMRDVNFAFVPLELDEAIESEAEELVEEAASMTFLKVTVNLEKSIERERTDAVHKQMMGSYNKRKDRYRKEAIANRKDKGTPKVPPRTGKKTGDLEPLEVIDQLSFQKYGIKSEAGYSGGKVAPPPRNRNREKVAKPPAKIYKVQVQSEPLTFLFRYRCHEFFDDISFTKYPALLEFHPWDTLNTDERKQAFKSLQEYHQDHEHAKREAHATARNNGIKVFLPRKFAFKDLTADDPDEWNPWKHIPAAKREGFFTTLQMFKKKVERRKVRIQAGVADPALRCDIDIRHLRPSAPGPSVDDSLFVPDVVQPRRVQAPSSKAGLKLRLLSRPVVGVPAADIAIKPEPGLPTPESSTTPLARATPVGDIRASIKREIKEEDEPNRFYALKRARIDIGAGTKESPFLLDLDDEQEALVREREAELTREIEETERIQKLHILKREREVLRGMC